VAAKNCLLACYNGMIAYFCPELPEQQYPWHVDRNGGIAGPDGPG